MSEKNQYHLYRANYAKIDFYPFLSVKYFQVQKEQKNLIWASITTNISNKYRQNINEKI